jgi:pimeloyl-ACP methyl ester carboxylesterase
MTTFVLVHGAFGTPAELAPVIPFLEASGHEALAVDLPCEVPTATLRDYAGVVAEAVDRLDGPVVLVAHSAGGATVALVPKLAAVARLIYVTAIVPEPGRSILEIVGPDVEAAVLDVSVDDGNGCRSFDIDKLAAMALPADRDAMREYLRATQRSQGWAVMHEPWPGDALPNVPSSYVLTLQDTLLPPAKQRAMAASLGVEPVEIVSDHEVFGTEPEALATALVTLANEE